MKRYFLFVTAAAMAAIGLTFSPVPAHAGIIHVVLPGQSIQAAVDAASPGDTIQLVQGTYRQSVTITTDGITLRGAGAGSGGSVLLPPPIPPAGFCATVPPDGPTHGGGICVFGAFDPATGAVTRPVADVHITEIRVEGAGGDGLAGYGTSGLTVDHVAVLNSGVFGILAIASQHATLADNLVDGVRSNVGAGMFLAFLPRADLVVTGNTVRDAALGINLVNVQDARVTHNDATGNCSGAFVVANNSSTNGIPPVNGPILIADNTFTANNGPDADSAPCLGNPPVQGVGLLLEGAQNTTVVHNEVTGNRGAQALSGGIALVSAVPFGGPDEGSDVIARNNLAGNAPVDVTWDQHGSDIAFSGNNCGTSSPARLCTGH